MSADQDSGTDARLIYVPLLDEGTPVLRPTRGVPLGNGRYRVEPAADYDPEDEIWEFPPGTVVVCEPEELEGESVLVAKARA